MSITTLNQLRQSVAARTRPDLVTAEFSQQLAAQLNAAGTTGSRDKLAAERVRLLDIQEAVSKALAQIGVEQVVLTREPSGRLRVEVLR